MKKMIHDGLGLRVMRGQESTHSVEPFPSDLTCPCGFHVCAGGCLPPYDDLPLGWAPGLGGYHHITGAEVQRRGQMWAWFPRDVNTCALGEYTKSLDEAMIRAAPRWSCLGDEYGRPFYFKGRCIIYTNGQIWKHNHTKDMVYYATAEAAMLAAERSSCNG